MYFVAMKVRGYNVTELCAQRQILSVLVRRAEKIKHYFYALFIFFTWRNDSIGTGYDLLPCFLFQFLAGLASDTATFSSSGSMFMKARCFHTFRYLPSRKFSQGGKNQFGLRHMVTQILRFKALDIFMLPDTKFCPFLMNKNENKCFLLS
ncbi:MAG: hypothetical protein DELT_02456 [Desulfovibrio sp.]